MATDRGEPFVTRPFAMGSFVFTVATTSAEDRALVESLFGDVPEPASAPASMTAFILRRADAEGGAWRIAGQRLDDVSVPSLSTALSLLIGEVNRGALDAEPEHLHLHAAMATKEGRAVVIAAPADTGKTTTVAQLVARGWAYGTDENVRLAADAPDVRGFRKPLSIKPGGRHNVGHLERWMIPPVGDGPEIFHFVPVGASGATVVEGGAPHLVVVLRRPYSTNPGGGAAAAPIHPADAVVALMEQTFDAERFGPTAPRLAALTAVSHCYELTVGTPSETVDQIEDLFRLDPVEPLDVSVLPSSKAFSRGVVSVLLGDRAVVHNTVTGRIFALDAGGARVWRHIGGQDDDGWGIDVDGPVIRPFVAQLRELGVLASAG